MSQHRMCIKAKCYHYKHEDTQVIYCDGVQEGSVVHLAFASKTDAKEYKTKYCRDKYESCPIYKMLEEIENGR